jgi:glycosyltransferase involved in cell wall biosynthesis
VHVAVVNQHPDEVVGGSELQCGLVARGLAARGHRVTYLAVGRSGGSASQGAERTTGPVEVVPIARDARSILAAVVELRPDVVYWRFNRRGLRVVARGLRSRAIPIVVALAHVNDVTAWPNWPWPGRGSTLRDRGADLRARIAWRREHSAYRDVTAIASQRSDLLGAVPLSTVALQQHVPNMMDPALVVAPAFIHPRPYVAWVANLKPRKRPHLLPGIAAALAPHGVDLLVAGPLSDPRSARFAGPLPEHPNLHHVGTLATEDVVAMLSSARCLAVTAVPEGFSNVMLQAWWVGTPTVSFDYDPDGIVDAERLGAVADGDVERLHKEIVRFATDAALAHDAGERARRFAHAAFDQERVLDRLEGLLAEVVAQ